ncbi:MAG: DUF2911 domain-containing protein [Flavobacteriaceae bacterium]
MKKPIVKLASITILAVLFSLTSCKEEVKETTKDNTEPVVVLKVTTPQPSPFSKVEQKVGLTDVTIEYSRPSMKGRTIFGDLVPFGKTWRTGANANTKVTFSSDVVVDGQTLKAGSYGVYTVPNKDKWEVMFYSESDKRGVPSDWDDTKVAAKTSVEIYPMPMPIETFTITFDDLTTNSAVIGLLWEKTYVGIKFQVPTDKMVMASIDATLSATPKAGDYYNAAIYYSQQNKDIKKANEWMNKAMSMTEKPAFWQLRQQSLIYAKMGDTKKAIEIAKKSLAGAKEAKNDAYIKMNTESLKEWEAK